MIPLIVLLILQRLKLNLGQMPEDEIIKQGCPNFRHHHLLTGPCPADLARPLSGKLGMRFSYKEVHYLF